MISFREQKNVHNEESSTLDTIANGKQHNHIPDIMISTGNEPKSQGKRQHTKSLDAYEEENLDKSDGEDYVDDDENISKRRKLQNTSPINNNRVRMIAERILMFPHIGFTLCQIASFSSKWKHEREMAINNLCDLELLVRISKGIRTPASRPFDYHIKLPPRNFSDFTEVEKFNRNLIKFKLDIHQLRSTYSSVDLGQLIALPPLINYLRTYPHIITCCPVSDVKNILNNSSKI